MKAVEHKLIQKATKIYGEDPTINSRLRRSVWSRWAVSVHLRKHGYSLMKIGGVLGRDHGTIIHGLRMHDVYMKNDREYIDLYNSFLEGDFVTVYIAGAITSEPNYAALFEAAEKKLRKMGLIPINPVTLNHAHDKTWLSYMREDLAALVRCSKVYALSNWQQSKGATIEVNLAISLGIEVIYEANSM